MTMNRLAAPLLALTLLSAPAFAGNEGFSAGLSVQPRASAADIGLPLYPGALPERDRDGDGDSEAATISLWGGPFGMDLHVMKLRSGDSVEAVSRFYRDAMQRQGRVVDCSRDAAPEPPVTAADGKLMRCGNDRAKAGAYLFKLALPGGVRMVAIEPAPGGARIQLVRLLLRNGD
jgi:hypothetical protein